MKVKITSLFLALAMIVSTTGCSLSKKNNEGNIKDTTSIVQNDTEMTLQDRMISFIETIEKEMNKEIGILNEKTFPQFVAKFHPESKSRYAKDEKEFSDLVKDNIKKMEEQ